MIFSSTIKMKKKHTDYIIKILKALKRTELKINGEKSTFHQTKVKFLKYILTTTDVKINPEKIKIVLDWPTPTTIKKIQKFIKFANFYRKFIRGYSDISALITNLIKKDKTFN
jgi:hypothetical protein